MGEIILARSFSYIKPDVPGKATLIRRVRRRFLLFWSHGVPPIPANAAPETALAIR